MEKSDKVKQTADTIQIIAICLTAIFIVLIMKTCSVETSTLEHELNKIKIEQGKLTKDTVVTILTK